MNFLHQGNLEFVPEREKLLHGRVDGGIFTFLVCSVDIDIEKIHLRAAVASQFVHSPLSCVAWVRISIPV